MNIGIIVYSQTGNTLSVAEKLVKALASAGHRAVINRVEAYDSEPNKPISPKLKSAPDIRSYDAVILASPVYGFSLPPIMKLYLTQIQSLSGKKVCCFVTQRLKKPWLGGNQTVRQIKSACNAKGSDIIASGVVNWSSPLREKQTEDIVSRFCAVITG